MSSSSLPPEKSEQETRDPEVAATAAGSANIASLLVDAQSELRHVADPVAHPRRRDVGGAWAKWL